MKAGNFRYVLIGVALLSLGYPFSDNAAVLDMRDGSRDLAQIRFSGNKLALQVEATKLKASPLISNA
jgi:hypothetical protein